MTKTHVGLDVHKKFCQVTVMDDVGKILDKRRLLSDKDELKEYCSQIPQPACLTLEAGRSWYWINDLMEDIGLEVKLSHPKKTRLIAEATLSTDEIDSEVLAHLERVNFLPTSYIPPRRIREIRELLRFRMSLVRIRSSLKNKIHAVLAKRGIKHNFSDLFGKAGKEFLKQLEVPPIFREEINGYLALIKQLAKPISKSECHIRQLVTEESPYAKLLMTIPGIGYFSALLLAAEIGDIKRFRSYRKLCSYGGVVSSTDETADKIRHGHIIKNSNKYIRWVLIEAVDKAIKKDLQLASSYLKVLRKKGKLKARIAVARKLLISIYFMLKNETIYQRPKRSSKLIYRFRAR